MTGEVFKGLDITTRCVFACIWDRYKLTLRTKYKDQKEGFVMKLDKELQPFYRGRTVTEYCVITQQEIAESLDISVRTAGTCVRRLVEAGIVDQHRAGYQAAARFTIPWKTDSAMPDGRAAMIAAKQKELGI